MARADGRDAGAPSVPDGDAPDRAASDLMSGEIWGSEPLACVVIWPIMCLVCISGGGGFPEPLGCADLCTARRAILHRPWAGMRLFVRHVRRPGG
jgi:hypothetical protein